MDDYDWPFLSSERCPVHSLEKKEKTETEDPGEVETKLLEQKEKPL